MSTESGEPADTAINIIYYDREELPSLWLTEVRSWEALCATEFCEFKRFDLATLQRLHAEGQLGAAAKILNAPSSPALSGAQEILRRVAQIQDTRRTREDRQAYLEAMIQIYEALPALPTELLQRQDVTFVGVEREGRMIAETLDWLPEGRSVQVHAKRLKPYGAGILVALSGEASSVNSDEAVIVDGAIASGATLIAVLDSLSCRKVHIYSAHATLAGLRGLCRFAAFKQIALTVCVGFTTGQLDEEYYAVEDGQKVLGDVGDAIAPLF